MQEIQGQLAKNIARRALPPLGTLYTEHEIPLVDAQAGDVYFVPEPGKEEGRVALGYLDHLTRQACLLEMIQSTPGSVVVRDNVRKQLTLDHSRALDARKQRRPRPPLLHLWMLSAGSPEGVLKGYDFRRAKGWPRGVWVRSRLDAVGIVVLSALPRRRDTLLLRLMGRGRVQREAIADLMALPPDAREREIAYEPLIALRMEVTQDPEPEEEKRAFIMATQSLYEEWKERTKAEGRDEGRAKGLDEGRAKGLDEGRAKGLDEGRVDVLVRTYEDRFGPMPERLRKAVAKKVDAAAIAKWTILFVTAPAEEIAAAVRKGSPSPRG